MLRIKPLEKYAIPRYPRGNYVARPSGLPWDRIGGGIASAALLALLESCPDGGGVTGPPPPLPNCVTENEARLVINRVFTENGIEMEEEVLLTAEYTEGNTVSVELDGYNQDMNVGYEYFSYDEDWEKDDIDGFIEAKEKAIPGEYSDAVTLAVLEYVQNYLNEHGEMPPDEEIQAFRERFYEEKLPKIETIGWVDKDVTPEYELYLEEVIIDFINELRAQGFI